MAIGPKTIELKLERILNAWETLAATKTFGGLTLEQMQAVAAPARAAREEIEDLEDRLSEALARRANADQIVGKKLVLVVNSVKGDPTEGPDSPLLRAMGYTRESERKTGLRRKRQPASPEADD